MDPQIIGQYMVFVDGTNVLRTLFKILELDRGPKPLRADRPTDAALDLARWSINTAMEALKNVPDVVFQQYKLVRRHWFGSVPMDETFAHGRREALRERGYDPHLIQQTTNKGEREKGVDLAVARKMLTHGFRRNYDAALLVAGDEDYRGLVEDLKDLGLRVFGAFYTTGLSPKLRVAFDHFVDLSGTLWMVNTWADHLRSEAAAAAEQTATP